MSSPALNPAFSIAVMIVSSAARFDGRFGAKPPSSPTAVFSPCLAARSSGCGISRRRSAAPREIRRADRQDHELLDVDAVVGVRAAVDDVHHRHRHRRAVPEVAEQRQSLRCRLGLGRRQRDREQRVGAEAPFVVGAVEVDHASIERALVVELAAEQRIAKLAVDVGDGFLHAFAEVARLVAVAQLDRFARSGRRARRHRGARSVPSASVTSASTVGLPRESRISRPRIR